MVYNSSAISFLWNILIHYNQYSTFCGIVEWNVEYLVTLCNFCFGGKTAAILDFQSTTSEDWVNRSSQQRGQQKREVAISCLLKFCHISSCIVIVWRGIQYLVTSCNLYVTRKDRAWQQRTRQKGKQQSIFIVNLLPVCIKILCIIYYYHHQHLFNVVTTSE